MNQHSPSLHDPARNTPIVAQPHNRALTLRDDRQTNPDDDIVTLREVLGVLVRQRWLIVGLFFLVMAIGLAILFSRTPMYRAGATLEFQRTEMQIIQGSEVQPATVADAEFMNTQFALLRSRGLAERVAEVLDLPSDPRYVGQKASRAERLALATRRVERNLMVDSVDRSRVVRVAFRSPYPGESARIANAVAEHFIQMTLERRFNTTVYARNFLEERLQTTKTSLEDAERRLVAYSGQKEIIDLSSVGGSEVGSSLDASALMALNTSLTTAQDDRIKAEQKFNEARSNPASRAALENDAIRKLRGDRAAFVGQRDELRNRYKDDYPEMVQLTSRIASIDKEIEGEIQRVLGSLENDYRAALAREDALKARVEELKGRVQDLRNRSIDYNILAREVDTLRAQYNALLTRYKEVSISSGIGASQVAIVDRAVTPRTPFEPNIPFGLGLILATSAALSLGIALARDFIDDTIKSPQDMKEKLRLAVIGVVPKLKTSQTFLDLLTQKRSAVAEAFTSARTALQFTTPAGIPRTMLITGVRPGEGKTSTTTGFGAIIAAGGKKVLIIDADLRRPSFVVGKDASVGLSGLLTGKGDLAANIVKGELDNLYLLPSGVIPPNPAELLTSAQMAELLSEASTMFDMVIVDSPPVLDFADAPALSSICEATLLVMQAGAVRRPVAQRTIDRLIDAQANLIGGFLTKFDASRVGYGYYDSYTYKYGYKYGYGATPGRKSVQAEINARRRIPIFDQSRDHDEQRDEDASS
jgi:polysaccharide biosynthesis transport protein